jgi:hypothetical protein
MLTLEQVTRYLISNVNRMRDKGLQIQLLLLRALGIDSEIVEEVLELDAPAHHWQGIRGDKRPQTSHDLVLQLVLWRHIETLCKNVLCAPQQWDSLLNVPHHQR